MRILISTPTANVVDAEPIRYVRAEDETGAFGIFRRHAGFLTILSISVVSWRFDDGIERFAAVRGGILMVSGGDTVSIVTREAVLSDMLETLSETVVARMQQDQGAESSEKFIGRRIELAAMREIQRVVSASGSGFHQASPMAPGSLSRASPAMQSDTS